MNLLQIISDLKQIAAECEKVTSGNVSHKIANIEYGIINIADYLENYCPLGWHPSSEHPPVDKETGFSELVVGIMPGDTVGFPQYVRYQKNEFYDRWIYGYTGVPSAINIKYWCYPPKD